MNWSAIFRSRTTVVAGAGLAVAVGVVSGVVWAASAPLKVRPVAVVPGNASATGSQLPISQGMGPQPSAAGSPSPRVLPSVSATASVPAPGSSASPASGVSASYHARRTWSTGMRADVTITTTASGPVTFTVDFVLDPRVSLDGDAWNAQATYSTGRLRLTGTINPGETINAGFNLKRPDSSVPLPQTCTVNGRDCSTVPG